MNSPIESWGRALILGFVIAVIGGGLVLAAAAVIDAVFGGGT